MSRNFCYLIVVMVAFAGVAHSSWAAGEECNLAGKEFKSERKVPCGKSTRQDCNASLVFGEQQTLVWRQGNDTEETLKYICVNTYVTAYVETSITGQEGVALKMNVMTGQGYYNGEKVHWGSPCDNKTEVYMLSKKKQ